MKLNLPNNIPQPKTPPQGYKWVNRGKGWIATDVRYATFNVARYGEGWQYGYNILNKSHTSGMSDMHYIELVATTLEEQLSEAWKMVDRNVNYEVDGLEGANRSFMPDSVMVFTGDTPVTKRSPMVNKVLVDHTYCVTLVDSTKSVPLFNCNSISDIVVKNVGDYSATVSKDDVKVGCQTITYEKFQEIADAFKTLGD